MARASMLIAVAVTGITVTLLPVVMLGAQLTLPELARLRGPEPVSRSRTRELVPPSFDVIATKADMIVHGRAVATKTYLSDDQMHLFTDYTITPINVLLQPTPMRPQPPGPPPQIIFKQFGGEMMIKGVKVYEQDDEMPPIPTGAEVVLVLTFDRTENKYKLASDIAGAFAVNRARIAPLMRPPVGYEHFNGMTLQDFANEVSRARRGKV